MKKPSTKTKSVKKSAPRRPVQGAGSPAPVELDGARGTSPGPLTGHLSLADRETVARELLSWVGRMVSGSKTSYLKAYPSHVVFFNANLYGGDGAKLWFGDVDFNLDADKLQHLADQLGETIYVTKEQPFRWEEQTVATLEAAILDSFQARAWKLSSGAPRPCLPPSWHGFQARAWKPKVPR